MTDIEKIKRSILAKIKPAKAEEQSVNRFVSDLLRVAKTVSGLDCVIVGSIGKGTWLRGDHDTDLFMLFPKDTSREELEKKGLAFGKKIVKEMRGKHEIKYSEHPYVHGYVKGFVIDVVPCYRIAEGEKIISAVDRSPLHLQYILENLKEHDEVRLLKQFFKGAGVYGSDVVKQGISGYVCELLVIRYGSFEGVAKAAAGWQPGFVIALNSEREHRKFYNHPLVLIDPIDANRNVAANLSHENFVKVLNAAKNFLKQPSEKYFFYQQPKPLSSKQLAALKARGSHFLALQMKRPGVVDDIIYLQLRRAKNRIEMLLRHSDFIVLRGMEFVDKEMFLIFELSSAALPDIKKMTGPPIFSRSHSKEFLEKYKNADYGPYLEDEYWVIEKKREFVRAEDMLKSFCRKGKDYLEAAGIPDNVAKSMKKCRIVSGPLFLAHAKKNKKLSAFLNKKYFEKL